MALGDRFGFLSSGWIKWPIRLVLLLVVVVALLPLAIAKTPLRHWILAKATAGLPLDVSIGDVSLAWWSPVSIDAIVVKDDAGAPLAQVASVRTERTLFSLATSKNLGTIVVERPEADLAFAGDSSNVEKLLAKFPKKDPPPPSNAKFDRTLTIEIVDGSVRVSDADTNRKWAIEKLGSKVTIQPAEAGGLAGKITAILTGEATPGSLDVDLAGAAGDAGAKGTVKARLVAVPIALAAPILRRGQANLECNGLLGADATLSWEMPANGALVAKVDGLIQGKTLEIAGGPLADRLVVAQLDAPVNVTYRPNEIDVTSAAATCEIGKVTAKGKLRLDRPILAALGESGAPATVEVDLAQLGQRLPKTIHLHPDVRLASGKASLVCQASPLPGGGAVLDGRIATTELRGARAGQPIAWDDPLSVAFKIRQPEKGMPEIEDLQATSRFFVAKGSATETTVRLAASADLEKLAKPLSQFVDIGAWAIAGTAQATIALQRNPQGPFALNAKVDLERFQLGAWREEQLTLMAEGTGQAGKAGEQRFDKGSVRVVAGDDLLNASLTSPLVIDAKGAMSAAAYATLKGDLGRWKHRLRPFSAALADVEAQGAATGQLWVALTPDRVDVQTLKFTAQNLKVRYGAYVVDDPDFLAQVACVLNKAENALDFKASQIRSQALVLHSDKLRVDLGRKAINGKVVFHGDLARLRGWAGLAEPMSGALHGETELRAGGDGFDLSLTASVKALAYGPPASPKFTDPLLQMVVRGSYDGKADQVSLQALDLLAQVGRVTGKAVAADLGKTLKVNVQGEISYDLSQAEPTIKAYLGKTARIAGKGTQPFRLTGPLRPNGKDVAFAALEGELGAGWDLLHAYGADVGPATARFALAGGSLKLAPVSTSLNQGKLNLAAAVRLDPAPMELTMPQLAVVQNAKLTPEICASALGYALPMLANVAEAQGELSLAIDGARLPLSEPTKGDLRGALTLHHAKVSAGPLVQQLSALLKTPAPYSFIRENTVKIKLEKGRVYHENLELVLPDQFTIRTSGSVGVDGSLEMIAEMPFPTKLLGNIKIPAAFAGVTSQPVRIPIGGTIGAPSLNTRALNDIVAQATRNAAPGAIGGLLEGQLNRILPPKK